MRSKIKDLRYQVMLALYLPILLYAFSTFDLDESAYVVGELEPVVVGERTVVLGQPFEAQAFLSVAGGQGQDLESAGALDVVGDSLFRMSTGELLAEDEDERTVTYEGSFGFQQVGGESVSIPIQGAFTVRRPEIVATSEATQALYRRTLNTIRFNVPGLEDRQLAVAVGGGEPQEGRTVSISPAGEAASVRVYLDREDGEADVFLGTKSFAVISPPRPEIQVMDAAGRAISSGDNLPRGRAMLRFDVEPDEEFRQRYPQDARYAIGRATVYLRRGMAVSEQIGTFDVQGGRLVLTQLLQEARPGDRIIVQLEGVYRINHAGQSIAVPFTEASRTFGFTLS